MVAVAPAPSLSTAPLAGYGWRRAGEHQVSGARFVRELGGRRAVAVEREGRKAKELSWKFTSRHGKFLRGSRS